MADPRIRAVDLFCGVGGLTHGLVRGGIEVVAGVDADPECRFPFEANNAAKFVQADVGQLTAERVGAFFGDAERTIRLLAGCAPCQPFSTYARSGRNPRHDKEWPLLTSFGRLVKELRPEFVTMENVPQVADHPVFSDFLASLDGYRVWWGVIDCAKLGVPQTRSRLVLMASAGGSCAPKPMAADCATRTVRQTIGDLPALAAGQTDPNDALHTCSKLSPTNLLRIQASVPGGTWRDWVEDLVAPCHQRSTGLTYPSVYGRMEWEKPSPTITTQCFGFGNGRFGHPEQDRAISLREAAMLQTFPRSYRFAPEGARHTFSKLGRMIGNAVPVRLGEVIADAILTHARQFPVRTA